MPEEGVEGSDKIYIVLLNKQHSEFLVHYLVKIPKSPPLRTLSEEI